MGENLLNKTLEDFGLSKKERQVYVFLAKNGIQKGGSISRSLNMHKAQIYRILKNLQSKGLAESTLESPMQFTAIPFENFLDLFIRRKKEEATCLERKRSHILASWKSIKVRKPVSVSERFVLIKGGRNIFSRLLQMRDNVEKELLEVATGLGIFTTDQAESDWRRATQKPNIRTRILTQTTRENLEKMKQDIREISNRYPKTEVRHTDLIAGNFPRFVIKDEDEIFFFTASDENKDAINIKDVGFWTNYKAFVLALHAFFERIWDDAKDTNLRK